MAVPTFAANFAVSPVGVKLGHGDRSQLITVDNEDAAPLRFQLNIYRWDERPDGQRVLTPTEDVIFFPRLFDLQPHEKQNVRVGVLAPALDGEKAYRLLIRQLKPFESPTSPGVVRTSVITVLTNIDIPVFVEPATPTVHGSIADPTLSNNLIKFAVRDTGNIHLRIKLLRVDGLGTDAKPVFSKQTAGGYILAGGSRNYELLLGTADCARVSRIDISVETDHGTLREQISNSGASCRRD